MTSEIQSPTGGADRLRISGPWGAVPTTHRQLNLAAPVINQTRPRFLLHIVIVIHHKQHLEKPPSKPLRYLKGKRGYVCNTGPCNAAHLPRTTLASVTMRFVCSVLLTIACAAYSPHNCELCEIALNEGFHWIVNTLNRHRKSGKQLNLAEEWEELKDDPSIWTQYSPAVKEGLEEVYLNNDDHWYSTRIRFNEIYGMDDFDSKGSTDQRRMSHDKAAGIRQQDVYGMWQKEVRLATSPTFLLPAFRLPCCYRHHRSVTPVHSPVH